MGLPIRAFWALVGNIHKIEADEDRRALRIAVCAQNTDGTKMLFDDFDEKLKGVVVVKPVSPMDAKPDPNAFNELRGLLLNMQ